MRTLLVASQKGGVGKTTTAVNLAALAAKAGTRVLLVDADPLGSVAASLHLSRDPEDGPKPRPDGVTGTGVVWANVLPNLDVLTPYPADSTGDAHLTEFLANLPGSAAARLYGRVVLDAPPMPGPRTKGLLKAADEVVIVQRAEPMSFRTLPVYLELIHSVRQEGCGCRLRGILMTLPAGVPAGGKAEQRLRERFKGLLPQTIPFDPEINRALTLGQPAAVMNPTCPAAVQYKALAAALGLAAGAPVRVAVGAGVGAEKPPRPAAKPASMVETPVSVDLPATPTPVPDDDVPMLPERPVRRKPNPLALPAGQKAAAGGSSAAWVAAAVAVGLLLAAVVWFALRGV